MPEHQYDWNAMQNAKVSLCRLEDVINPRNSVFLGSLCKYTKSHTLQSAAAIALDMETQLKQLGTKLNLTFYSRGIFKLSRFFAKHVISTKGVMIEGEKNEIIIKVFFKDDSYILIRGEKRNDFSPHMQVRVSCPLNKRARSIAGRHFRPVE